MLDKTDIMLHEKLFAEQFLVQHDVCSNLLKRC